MELQVRWKLYVGKQVHSGVRGYSLRFATHCTSIGICSRSLTVQILPTADCEVRYRKYLYVDS